MKTIRLLILTTAISLNTAFAQENGVKDDKTTIETSCLELPRIEVVPIKDTKTERPYELYIKLPEGYSEDKDIQYPVIYFTDAMWNVEVLSGSAEYIVEEAILVGISWQKDLKLDVGVHVSRFRDYSMRESSNPERQAKYQFGQANNHLTFIRNDVITYVENNYRADPDKRTYFGYSLGGEFGTYILLTQPDTFKNYILGSPSLNGEIPYLSELESNVASKHRGLNTNVFVSYGALERELGEHVEKFITMLKTRNDESLSLKHVVIESADHSRAFPMTAVRSMYWLSDLMKE